MILLLFGELVLLMLLLTKYEVIRSCEALEDIFENKLPDAAKLNDITRYPFVVSVQIFDKGKTATVEFYSGGTLVSNNQVLTVCRLYLPDNPILQEGGGMLVVVVGSALIKGDQNWTADHSQTRKVVDIIRHSKCQDNGNATSVRFDVAILKLRAPVETNQYVQPIPFLGSDRRTMLSDFQKLMTGRQTCEVFRWGWEVLEKVKSIEAPTNINSTSEISGQMGLTLEDHRFEETTVFSFITVSKMMLMPSKECEKHLCHAAENICGLDIDSMGHICATPWDSSNYVCLDVGGPLVCNGFLVGVLSYELCTKPAPAVLAGPETISDLLQVTLPSTPQTSDIDSSVKKTCPEIFLYAWPVGQFLSEWCRLLLLIYKSYPVT